MLPTTEPASIEERIVRTAIAECSPKGSTFRYFASNPWEASMRQEFAAYVRVQTELKMVAVDEGVKLLRLLNAKYSARYPVAALPRVYESATRILHEHGWWGDQAPNLFLADNKEVQEIVKVFTEILALVAQHPVPQPYSLLTKWLHFCLPDTFVICDSQAVNSIQASSDLLHKHFGPRSLPRRQFRVISIYEKGGKGYEGALNFYRLCGEAADKAGMLAGLQEAAQRLEAIQHQIPGCRNTRISVLDVLDKHF